MKDTISIVVCDPDDPLTIGIVAEALKEYLSILIPCTSPEAVGAAIECQPVDVVVVNLQKPLKEAFRLLLEIQTKAPQAEVIFVAEFADDMLRSWMEIIRRGAYEFLVKPLDPTELKHQVVRATEKHHPVRLQKGLFAESVMDLNAAARKKTLAQAQAWRLTRGM